MSMSSETVPVPRALLDLVREMRTLQRLWFATGRDRETLAAAKRAERAVDRALYRALAALDAPQLSLTDAPSSPVHRSASEVAETLNRSIRPELVNPKPPEPAPPACDHGVTFDAEAARGLSTAEIRKRWPAGWGPCPKGCGWSGKSYASMEHFVAADG